MFSGIITHIAVVDQIKFSTKKDCLLVIDVQSKITRKLEIGCSVACDGICLTLIKQQKNKLFFQASKETCLKTTLKNWRVGTKINIEFALKIGDEIGGHLVSGHVDGCAKLKDKKLVKDSVEMIFELKKSSQDLAKFIATKGSICLNGISLTVNKSDKKSFSVNLIPHSLQNTNFGEIKIGDLVNVEIDLIARYAARIRDFLRD